MTLISVILKLILIKWCYSPFYRPKMKSARKWWLLRKCHIQESRAMRWVYLSVFVSRSTQGLYLFIIWVLLVIRIIWDNCYHFLSVFNTLDKGSMTENEIIWHDLEIIWMSDTDICCLIAFSPCYKTMITMWYIFRQFISGAIFSNELLIDASS